MYVAIMKSCSTTNAVFLAWRINLEEISSLGSVWKTYIITNKDLYRNLLHFLWILSMCKWQWITHKLDKSQRAFMLTLVLLNPDIPCLWKQRISRSAGFWLCTVCHLVCDFMSIIWIKESDWLAIRNRCGIFIYSAWQWLSLWVIRRLYLSIKSTKYFFFYNYITMSYLPRKMWVK